MKPWLSAVPLLVACSHAAPPQTAAAPAAPARDAVAAFEMVRVVLQSPRCVNCHPVGDVPLQGDHGRRQVGVKIDADVLRAVQQVKDECDQHHGEAQPRPGPARLHHRLTLPHRG